MSTTIAQRTLRNDNAAIIDAVAAGETFIVTRNGTPVAELRPITPARRRFVPKTVLTAIAASGSRIDAAALRAELDELIDQSL